MKGSAAEGLGTDIRARHNYSCVLFGISVVSKECSNTIEENEMYPTTTDIEGGLIQVFSGLFIFNLFIR